MTELIDPPPFDPPDPPPEPQEQLDYEAIMNSDDKERETFKSDGTPSYRISEVIKSRSLDKKIVKKFNYVRAIWEPTGEQRYMNVVRTDFLLYAYDDDIGPQEISIIGSRYIDTEIPKM